MDTYLELRQPKNGNMQPQSVYEDYLNQVFNSTPRTPPPDNQITINSGADTIRIPNPECYPNPAYYLPNGKRTIPDVVNGALGSINQLDAKLSRHRNKDNPHQLALRMFDETIRNMTLVTPKEFSYTCAQRSIKTLERIMQGFLKAESPTSHIVICTPWYLNPNTSGKIMFDEFLKTQSQFSDFPPATETYRIGSDLLMHYSQARLGDHEIFTFIPNQSHHIEEIFDELVKLGLKIEDPNFGITYITDTIQSGHEISSLCNETFNALCLNNSSTPGNLHVPLNTHIDTAYFNPGELASDLRSIALDFKELKSNIFPRLTINALQRTSSWVDLQSTFNRFDMDHGFNNHGLVGSIRSVGQANGSVLFRDNPFIASSKDCSALRESLLVFHKLTE